MALLVNRNQFIQAYNSAPKLVRDAMGSDRTLETIRRVKATYSLHVDVAGKLTEELGYMLLGLVDPSAFYKDLLELGIPAQNATEIVKEINQEIFLPLQEKIRSGVSVEREMPEEEPEAEYDPELDRLMQQAQVSVQHAPPAPSIPRPQIPVLQVMPAEPPLPVIQNQTGVPDFNLIRPVVLASQPTPIQQTIIAPAVQMRTMQHDIQVLQDPNTPPLPAPQMPHPSQVTPARSFQTASVPFTSIQPTAPQPVPVPHQVIQPQPNSAPAQQTPEPQVSAVRQSGSDPYREPI